MAAVKKSLSLLEESTKKWGNVLFYMTNEVILYG